jgi:hypothetical protein
MSHSQGFFKQGFRARVRSPRTILVFFGVVLLFWATSVVCASFFVFNKTLEARDALIVSKTQALDLAFDQASESLAQAQKSLDHATYALPILESIGWFPGMGRELLLTVDIIRSQRAITQALSPMYDLGNDLMRLSGLSKDYLERVSQGLSPAITFGDLPTQTKRAILDRLAGSARDFDLLASHIELAKTELDLLLKEATLGPVLNALEPLRKELDSVGSRLEFLRVASHILPAFAGLSDPSINLLLFLNNDELRPGGGFIGSYGVLRTYGGDIQSLETADVYALDSAAAGLVTTTAPEPLVRYNQATKWFFRDANWSPDFAISTQKSIELFLSEVALLGSAEGIPTSSQIDNVIAFTPTYTADLLAITGPITVSGQTFTKDNVADLLEYQVEYGYAKDGLPEAQRKEILSDLINEMKTRLYALPFLQWEEVSFATQRALREKQLLLYSQDEAVERMIARENFGGVIAPTTSDVIMVVDANLASLKSDPVVDRAITYSIARADSGEWVGRVDITYKHTGTFDWKTTRYRTYTRVLVPLGSEFVRAQGTLVNDRTKDSSGAPGTVDVFEDAGMQTFGAFTSIEPGDEHTLSFDFKLSQKVIDAIKEGEYDLTILKQPGARNHALTLDLNFDKNVTRAIPGEDSNQWGDDAYRLNTILDQDVEVGVKF